MIPIAIALGTTGLTLFAKPAVVVTPVVGVLHLVGFGAGGIFADSAAATAQARIGNVLAPSLFATLTSAAMGGYGVAAIAGVVKAVGLAVTGVGAVAAAFAALF